MSQTERIGDSKGHCNNPDYVNNASVRAKDTVTHEILDLSEEMETSVHPEKCRELCPKCESSVSTIPRNSQQPSILQTDLHPVANIGPLNIVSPGHQEDNASINENTSVQGDTCLIRYQQMGTFNENLGKVEDLDTFLETSKWSLSYDHKEELNSLLTAKEGNVIESLNQLQLSNADKKNNDSFDTHHAAEETSLLPHKLLVEKSLEINMDKQVESNLTSNMESKIYDTKGNLVATSMGFFPQTSALQYDKDVKSVDSSFVLHQDLIACENSIISQIGNTNDPDNCNMSDSKYLDYSSPMEIDEDISDSSDSKSSRNDVFLEECGKNVPMKFFVLQDNANTNFEKESVPSQVFIDSNNGSNEVVCDPTDSSSLHLSKEEKIIFDLDGDPRDHNSSPTQFLCSIGLIPVNSQTHVMNIAKNSQSSLCFHHSPGDEAELLQCSLISTNNENVEMKSCMPDFPSPSKSLMQSLYQIEEDDIGSIPPFDWQRTETNMSHNNELIDSVECDELTDGVTPDSLIHSALSGHHSVVDCSTPFTTVENKENKLLSSNEMNLDSDVHDVSDASQNMINVIDNFHWNVAAQDKDESFNTGTVPCGLPTRSELVQGSSKGDKLMREKVDSVPSDEYKFGKELNEIKHILREITKSKVSHTENHSREVEENKPAENTHGHNCHDIKSFEVHEQRDVRSLFKKNSFSDDEMKQFAFNEEEFSWDDYNKQKNCKSVPGSAFSHVEKSLASIVTPGQFVEVLNSKPSDSFWVAEVVYTCNSLLRLKFVVPEGTKDVIIWEDLNSGRLRALRSSFKNGLTLALPPELTGALKESDLVAPYLREAKLAFHKSSVPASAINYKHYSVFAQITPGMKAEILAYENETIVWPVTVIENVGGRLLVEYFNPFVEDANGTSYEAGNKSPTMWIFFTDYHLKELGWCRHVGFPWRYLPPEQLSISHQNWDSSLDEFIQEIEKTPVEYLDNSFANEKYVENVVEGVLPTELDTFCNFYVAGLVGKSHLQLIPVEKGQQFMEWITALSNPLLNIPRGPGGTLNSDENISTQELAAASAEAIGFCVGQTLEVSYPSSSSVIHAATIKMINKHMLWLKLMSSDSLCIPVSAYSSCIFPTGWCLTNNLPLKKPLDYIPVESSLEEEQEVQQNISSDQTSCKKVSSWCPVLYVNHCCYAGPFLTRKRVAWAVKSIGPGPVETILREVVNKTISMGFIPTRVLREIESNLPMNSAWPSVTVKAKFKRASCVGKVHVTNKASEVDTFLMSLAEVLNYCPNLWSRKLTKDTCPYSCNGQSQGGNGGVVHGAKGRWVRGSKKKRRLRKRLYWQLQQRNEDKGALQSTSDLDCENELHGSSDDFEFPSRGHSPLPRENLPIRKSSIRLKLKRKHHRNTFVPSFPPAVLSSNPMLWTVDDVAEYISSQPSISHFAVKLKEEEVDGMALLLLNLPTLTTHFNLPHIPAVKLAQHICFVKLAHYLNYFKPSK